MLILFDKITDPYVERILINQAHIERQLLSKTRREGEELLRNHGRAGHCWTGDGFLLKRFPCVVFSLGLLFVADFFVPREGGESTAPLAKGRNDNTSQLLTGRDSVAQRKCVLVASTGLHLSLNVVAGTMRTS